MLKICDGSSAGPVALMDYWIRRLMSFGGWLKWDPETTSKLLPN